eukprot:COSAG04_NODE_10985_length_739_cov_1.081250_1_plen_86_part_10
MECLERAAKGLPTTPGAEDSPPSPELADETEGAQSLSVPSPPHEPTQQAGDWRAGSGRAAVSFVEADCLDAEEAGAFGARHRASGR